MSAVRLFEFGFAFLIVLALLVAALPLVASAADAGLDAIKGVEVMGDKDRSALDGFSQAPVAREESAALDAPNPGGSTIAQERTRAVSAQPPSTEHGQDPQEPRPVVLPGPANNILAGP